MCDVYRGVTCNCLVVGCRYTDGSCIGTSSTNWCSNQHPKYLEISFYLTAVRCKSSENGCEDEIPTLIVGIVAMYEVCVPLVASRYDLAECDVFVSTAVVFVTCTTGCSSGQAALAT
jgi:hypothetical protein